MAVYENYKPTDTLSARGFVSASPPDYACLSVIRTGTIPIPRSVSAPCVIGEARNKTEIIKTCSKQSFILYIQAK